MLPVRAWMKNESTPISWPPLGYRRRRLKVRIAARSVRVTFLLSCTSSPSSYRLRDRDDMGRQALPSFTGQLRKRVFLVVLPIFLHDSELIAGEELSEGGPVEPTGVVRFTRTLTPARLLRALLSESAFGVTMHRRPEGWRWLRAVWRKRPGLERCSMRSAATMTSKRRSMRKDSALATRTLCPAAFQRSISSACVSIPRQYRARFSSRKWEESSILSPGPPMQPTSRTSFPSASSRTRPNLLVT